MLHLSVVPSFSNSPSSASSVPNRSPSSSVVGRCFLWVSGRKNIKQPATTAKILDYFRSLVVSQSYQQRRISVEVKASRGHLS